MKKIIAFLLALLAAASLPGCAPRDESHTAITAQPSPEAALQGAGNIGEPIRLTLWSIATESDNYYRPYLYAIAEYEKAHPNIKIEYESFENESYKTKLKSAVAANELPDIFFTWGGGFSQPFVDAGRVLCVDDEYAKNADLLPRVMVENLTYDGKVYGSVYTMNVSMLFYNKAMFSRYGLEPPKTFDELVGVCQTFIDNGIVPFGISAKDIWNLAMTHDALTLKAVGPDTLKSCLTKKGTIHYNSADFLNASRKFSELVRMGAYSPEAVALNNDEATQTFYEGKEPMYITGSWMVSDFYTKAHHPEDFGCVPIPVLNSATAKITDFMGGPSDSLMVSASTKYPAEAAEAVFEISKYISKYAYLSGSGIAAWDVDYDASSVRAQTQEIAALVQHATSFTLWFDTLMESEDASVYLKNLQQLYLGDLTPEEFVNNMAEQLKE